MKWNDKCMKFSASSRSRYRQILKWQKAESVCNGKKKSRVIPGNHCLLNHFWKSWAFPKYIKLSGKWLCWNRGFPLTGKTPSTLHCQISWPSFSCPQKAEPRRKPHSMVRVSGATSSYIPFCMQKRLCEGSPKHQSQHPGCTTPVRKRISLMQSLNITDLSHNFCSVSSYKRNYSDRFHKNDIKKTAAY